MLTVIGRSAEARDAVDLFLECHERIRSFLALARRLATARGAGQDDVRETAARIHRYFAEALPLHAQDEEESLLPRLRGLDPVVDRELETMAREHGEHGRPLRALLDACLALVGDPALHATLAPELESATGELERHFDAHLRREEEIILPAARRLLDPHDDAAIVRELRARRGVVDAPSPPNGAEAPGLH